MALDEILASAKQSLLDRVASPLIGSFVVAWGLWNWKFLVILFSNATVSQTFAMIDRIVFPDATTFLTRGVLYPLLSAAAYIFIYPYPARFVYAFTLRRQRESNQTKQTISNETPLTLEESRRLRAEYVEHERKNTEVVEKLNEEVARLNAALDAATTPENEPPPPQKGGTPSSLEPTQVFLLHILEKIGSPALESELLQNSPETQVKTEFDIGELERLKLLTRNFDERRREYTLEFTHEGRRTLLQSKAPEA